MMAGTLLAATGACPVCGRDVSRTHGFNGTTLTERYACFACGETRYAVRRRA